MNPTDKLLAWAQIILSFLWLGGTFVLEYTGKLSADASAWLRDTSLLVLYFWFQRQRTSGIPDPTQIVTQTKTTPDGTTTVITKPLDKGPTNDPSKTTPPSTAAGVG